METFKWPFSLIVKNWECEGVKTDARVIALDEEKEKMTVVCSHCEIVMETDIDEADTFYVSKEQ